MTRLSDEYLQTLVDYPDQFSLEKSYMARELLALRRVAELSDAYFNHREECGPEIEGLIKKAILAWEEP